MCAMSMFLRHALAPMTGRDPREAHRTATPLELLFDLTFVIAFSQAGTQASKVLELGHVWSGVLGFAIAMFAIMWAWINYSWLASAYDNDDLFFRLATFVEMVGVLVMALGMPQFFASLDGAVFVDNTLMISGYVVMRVATIALWLRVAAHDAPRRRTALTYAIWLSAVQVGWVVVLVAHQAKPVALPLMTVLVVLEMLGPWIAERHGATPWHAHHIAERYGLLVIITLGEVLLGTILAISAVVEEEGWSAQAILIAVGGTLLAFAMWWVYFALPSAPLLHRHRDRAFVWGYGHMVLIGAIAAVGAGLHVAALVIGAEAEVDAVFALLCVAIPVLVFEITLFGLYTHLTGVLDPLNVWLFTGAAAILVAAALVSASGAPLGVALLIVALSPVAVVVGHEAVGHRHRAAVLAREDS